MEVFVNNNSNKTRRFFIDDEDGMNDVNRYGDSVAGSAPNANNEMNAAAASSHDSFDSSADDDCGNDQQRFNGFAGLVGLQNIANTCYMNAALQALSNTPPLTRYFLDCGDIIEANSELAVQTSNQRKAGLAKSYHRLVKDMWSKHRRANSKTTFTLLIIFETKN